MTTIPASVRAVIESGRLGHLVTLNTDGSPQVTCVWVGIQDDELVTAHLRDQRLLGLSLTTYVPARSSSQCKYVHGELISRTRSCSEFSSRRDIE